MTTTTMAARFPGTCATCKVRFPEGTAIVWAKGYGARHATVAACEVAVATKPVPVPLPAIAVGEFAGVVALFAKAKAHLKFPKIKLHAAGVPVILSVAGPKSKTPGAIVITGEGSYPDRAYWGSVSVDGAWTPSRSTSPFMKAALATLLAAFSADPATVAAEHGKLTGHCAFCAKLLGAGEDKRSVAVGYGPVCADHYGLKDEWLHGAAAADAVPVAA